MSTSKNASKSSNKSRSRCRSRHRSRSPNKRRSTSRINHASRSQRHYYYHDPYYRHSSSFSSTSRYYNRQYSSSSSLPPQKKTKRTSQRYHQRETRNSKSAKLQKIAVENEANVDHEEKNIDHASMIELQRVDMINKLTYSSNQVSQAGNKFHFYKGNIEIVEGLEQFDVYVKKGMSEVLRKEAEFLFKLRANPRVITCYGLRKNDHLYSSLVIDFNELTLRCYLNMLKNNDNTIILNKYQMMEEIALALVDVHACKIVHNKITEDNIFINENGETTRVILANFDEATNAKDENYATDIRNFGIVYRKVITMNGLVKENNFDTLVYQSTVEVKPALRPQIKTVLKNPVFWTNNKIVLFFMAVSNAFKAQWHDTIEQDSEIVFTDDWTRRLDQKLIGTLRKYRKYDGERVLHLVRAIRNIHNHYTNPADIVPCDFEVTKKDPANFINYFSHFFPRLLFHVYIKTQKYKHIPIIAKYYDENYNYNTNL